MSFRAVLDACVLVPYLLCNVSLHLAEEDLYDPLWSADILDEVQRTLLDQLDLDAAATVRVLRRLRVSYRRPATPVCSYTRRLLG